MTDEKTETRAERDERVRLAEQDRADRAKVSPLTGVRTLHDVIRHLVTHGPGADKAHRAELLAVIDKADPDVKTDPKAGK